MSEQQKMAEANNQNSSEESELEQEENENDAEQGQKSESENTTEKPEKEKPHPDTIKYAELLKKQMGNAYKSDWDKLPINKRVEKMETIMEFLETEKELEAGKPKPKKETRLPSGKPAPKANEINTGKYPNYAALAAKLNKK